MNKERPARPWDIFNKNLKIIQKDIVEHRMALCNSCPELIQSTSTCKQCGCFMKLKTQLSNASCPLNKWQAVSVPIYEDIEGDAK